MVREKIRSAQDRFRHWANARRRNLHFKVGDHAFLKISPNRGVIRFGMKGKLSPRFIGPFDIMESIGDVAYRLALPPSLIGVHDVFHISQLRGYVYSSEHIVDHSELEVTPDLTYEPRGVAILDRAVKELRSKKIPMVRVLWRPDSFGHSTWITEAEARERYPHLFQDEDMSQAPGKTLCFISIAV